MTEQPDYQMRKPLDEPPPFLRSWKNVYGAVLCYLAALIALLYVITRRFSY